MYNFLRESLFLFFNVVQISLCEHLLTNYIGTVDRTSLEDDNFMQPVIVNIELDKYGQDDVYIYQNIPANISRDGSENLRRTCTGGNCGPPPRPKRPASKDYPTMMHCRGLLAYCRKECVELSSKMCDKWPFMCPGETAAQVPDRCRIQCLHNYRQMRIRFPNQPKLPRDTNPRYDRFDYY